MKSYKNKILIVLLIAIVFFGNSYILVAQDIIPFKDGELYGLKNSAGEVIVQAKYNEPILFSEGIALLSEDFGEEGTQFDYIDTLGNKVLPNKYYFASSFKEGLAYVSFRDYVTKKVIYAFIDKTGKVVINLPKEQFSMGFSNGLASVSISYGNEKYKFGYIDKTGKVIIPIQYDVATDFSDGLAIIAFGNKVEGYKYGCINKTGKVIIPLKYDDINYFMLVRLVTYNSFHR